MIAWLDNRTMMRLSIGPGSIPAGQVPTLAATDRATFFSISISLRVASGFGKALFPLFLFLGSAGRLDVETPTWWAGGRTAPSAAVPPFRLYLA